MEQKRLQDIENYLRRGEYPAGTEKKDKPNFRRRCRNSKKFEGGVLYYNKCSGKELEQVQANSQELQNGGCVSGVRRKRRGSWSHAMGEQLGVTLEGIKPWRRFVPGFIGETWSRRFENMWRSAHSVRRWMPILSLLHFFCMHLLITVIPLTATVHVCVWGGNFFPGVGL